MTSAQTNGDRLAVSARYWLVVWPDGAIEGAFGCHSEAIIQAEADDDLRVVKVVPAITQPAVEPADVLLAEARAFLDTRHGPDGSLRRPVGLIARIDAKLAEEPR